MDSAQGQAVSASVLEQRDHVLISPKFPESKGFITFVLLPCRLYAQTF